MDRFTNHIRQVRRGSRKGAAVVLILLTFTVMIAFAVLAVDYGFVNVAKQELQAASDASSLAAAGGLPKGPAEARARAKDIAAMNKAGGVNVKLDDDDIEFGTWNATAHTFTLLPAGSEYLANSVRVNAQMSQKKGRAVGLFFGAILGSKTADVHAQSIAGFSQAADIVLVQDVTSSFTEELPSAKQGDLALLDSLYANGTGTSSFGAAVFTGWGKTLTKLKRLNTNYTSIRSAVDSIALAGSPGMPIASGTDISTGLDEAMNIFNDISYKPDPGITRAIVLVSDGQPSQNFKAQNATKTSAELLLMAQSRADAAWKSGIHVYVVFFDRDNNQTQADNMRSLARGRGEFIQVTVASDLPIALESITRRLPMQLLK